MADTHGQAYPPITLSTSSLHAAVAWSVIADHLDIGEVTEQESDTFPNQATAVEDRHSISSTEAHVSRSDVCSGHEIYASSCAYQDVCHCGRHGIAIRNGAYPRRAPALGADHVDQFSGSGQSFKTRNPSENALRLL